jgi:hypothetical protein
MDRKEIVDILRVGLKAASPYNLQPWKFKFKNEKLLIFAQYGDKGFLYHFQECILYSLGALLENLSQGAKHYHYEMTYHLLADKSFDKTKPLCEVSFQKIVDAQDYDIKHVLSRYTNRNLYSKKKVAPSFLAKINTLFQGKTRRVRDVTNNDTMIDNCSELEKIRAANFELNSEFIGCISFSSFQGARCRQGFDARVLGVPLWQLSFLWLEKNKYFRQIVGGSYLSQFVTKSIYVNWFRRTPLLLAFEEDDSTVQSLVRDWMDIQRIINDLHREGLSSHLIASGVDLTKMDPAFFSAKENTILDLAQSNVQNKMGISLKKILTLLRVGYAKECLVKSLRMNPEDLLLPENK